jgi:hypothetical protein
MSGKRARARRWRTPAGLGVQIFLDCSASSFPPGTAFEEGVDLRDDVEGDLAE